MKSIYFLVLIYLFSFCTLMPSEKIVCEAFDFKKLPYDKGYFLQNLRYTNGIDTLNLDYKDLDVSKHFVCDKSAMCVDCNPSFNFTNEDTLQLTSISSTFHYHPLEENKMILSLLFNSCYVEVMLDTININQLETILPKEKYRLNDTEGIIERIKLKKLKVVQIEMESGETWRLIEN